VHDLDTYKACPQYQITCWHVRRIFGKGGESCESSSK